MAGAASPEDSEPLFVLEPLPELSSVIDSFAFEPSFLDCRLRFSAFLANKI